MKIGLESPYQITYVDGVEIVNDSIDNLMQQHKDGLLDAVCSVGDTREVYIQAMKTLGFKDKFMNHKAFIVSPISIAESNKTLYIGDLGANPEMDVVDFIDMYNLITNEWKFSRTPLFGLINIGEEPYKGDQVRKELFSIFSTNNDYIGFVGNVEGHELTTTNADILLVDGFTGNVLIKTLEGVGAVDYRKIGGVKMLGFNGKVYVGHGRSDHDTITTMIRRAIKNL